MAGGKYHAMRLRKPRCIEVTTLSNLERQQFSLMNPSPSRDQELLNIARGAETWPIAGVQKSHDARKGCSVVRSVGLGEHLLMQG